MKVVTLGRTGLRVSVAGLGCGGHSRLGQTAGATERESGDVVRCALDLGVTHIDTAQAYGTEEVVGKALRGRRDEVVLATKMQVRRRDGSLLKADAVRESIEDSLRRLRTDRIDVVYLHAVTASLYDYCVAELVPEVQRLMSSGGIRFLGVSENFGADPTHLALRRAVADDCWDVMMTGFNIINPSARKYVLPTAIEKGVGVTAMYVVRGALADPVMFAEIVQQLAEEGYVSPSDIELSNPLRFLVDRGSVASVTEAAYRFALGEPGVHVTLIGTGSVQHLKENLSYIDRGALPEPDRAVLDRLFGDIEHVAIQGRRRP